MTDYGVHYQIIRRGHRDEALLIPGKALVMGLSASGKGPDSYGWRVLKWAVPCDHPSLLELLGSITPFSTANVHYLAQGGIPAETITIRNLGRCAYNTPLVPIVDESLLMGGVALRDTQGLQEIIEQEDALRAQQYSL